MAITARTIDSATRVPFFKKTKNGGLVDLHFDLVTIDGQTFYQPVWPGRRTEDGTTQSGILSPPIILDRLLEMPIPARQESAQTQQYGAWFYGGR